MVRQKITITNPCGLHLRPARTVCETAMKYQSSVKIEHQRGTADAKSLLSVLGAMVRCGDEIVIVCEGSDEEEALADVIRAAQSGSEEDSAHFHRL